MKFLITLLILFSQVVLQAQESMEPLPAPKGLRAQVREVKTSGYVKRWEVSYQGLSNFFYGRPELSEAKNKIHESGRYAWSEVVKIQHTWDDAYGHYWMARALFGNSNFGDQTYGVQGAMGWAGEYYQFGVIVAFQKYSEQYYLNEFKFNPKNPPPPSPPGQKGSVSFTTPLPDNPCYGLELNFRIPLNQEVNFKVNNQILPGLTTHGFGVEWVY